MNKTFCCLLCLLAVINSGIAQPAINERFPTGHYELSINEIHFSLDLFENNRIMFHYQMTGATEEAGPTNVLITGSVTPRQDSLLIEADPQSQWVQILYAQNPDIAKGKIRIQYMDEGSPDDYVAQSMASLAVGKNLKREDYQTWELFVKDRTEDGDTSLAQVDYQAGDTLSLRLFSPLASGRAYYYQYVFPPKVNDVRIRFTSGTGIFDLDAARLCKGASDNEMRLVFNFKESISLYYTRPVNDADLQQYAGSLTGAEGYTYMKATKSYMLSEEEEVEASYEEGYGSYESPEDTIVYYTSLEKAMEVAKHSNKFIRLYIVGPEICDAPNPLTVLQNRRSVDDYYTMEFLKKVVNDYVICVLPAYDAKVTKRYELDMMQPARLVLTKDGTLLYKEYGCNENKSSLAYFNEDPFYYDYVTSKFNALMHTLYGQKVLAPQLLHTAKADKKLLKEYLDNIFKCVKREYYAIEWATVCQEIAESKNDSTYTDQLPDTCISAAEIGRNLDRYVGEQVKAPFNGELAEIILLYYSKVYDYADYPTDVPASLMYLLRHYNELDTVVNGSDYLTYVSPYELVASVIYPLNYGMEQASELSAGDMVGMMERVLKALPESADKPEWVYDFYMSIRNDASYIYDAEVLDFLDGYVDAMIEGSDSPEAYYDLSDMLNAMAWGVYKSKIQALYDKALAWSAKSSELFRANCSCDNYYYLDTYAHLLYAKGDYDGAVAYQKKALEAVSEEENPEGLAHREIKVEYELMKLRMVGDE